MDFTSRKPAVKYGKKQSKVSSYNFFGSGTQSLSSSTAGQLPISPESPARHGQVPPAEPASPTRLARTSSPVMTAHITSHSPDVPSRSQSPIKPPDNRSTATAMFDMLDSEDEHESQGPPKKRKLEKPKKMTTKPRVQKSTETTAEQDRVEQVNITKPAKSQSKTKAASTKTQTETAQKGGDTIIGLQVDSTSDQAATRIANQVTVKTATLRKPLVKQTSRKTADEHADPQPLVANRKKVNDPIRSKAVQPIEDGDVVEDVPKSASRVKAKAKKATYGTTKARPIATTLEPLTDAVSKSRSTQIDTDTDMADTPQTPSTGKDSPGLRTSASQKRRLYDSDVSVGSPSQLGLRELRLTPELDSRLRRGSTASTASVAPTPRRGRARRIDLLDAPEPEPAPAHTTSQSTSISRSGSSLRKKTTQATAVADSQPLLSRPQLSRTNSSSGRQTYGRAKATFGKDRSHLKDMVDDLDMLSAPSSQEASQQLASHLTSSSQPSQLQMQFELDDSSGDDLATGGRIKSIHELRQAGANSRYERDLESMMDEIDPKSTSSSRITKIQTLIKLFEKLVKERSFESFVADHAIDRLTTWSKSSKDKIVRLLYDMTFWRLVHNKSTTPKRLGAILVSITVSTATISNLNNLAQTARDPAEKLTKSMMKELQEFEVTILGERLLPSYDGDRIVPAAITIAALNDSLRKLVEAGSRNITMGKTAYEGVIAILRRAAQVTAEQSFSNMFVTKCALSLLQTFAGPLGSNLELSDTGYVELGNTMAGIVHVAMDRQEDMVQTVLHFAISLCNDRPNICENINRSDLSTSLMTIIDTRFLLLVATAQTGSVDSGMLDSIILSLACLLNIAEYSDEVRHAFASSSNHAASLAAIYNQAAPQLTQAATAEQSQVLVAFGYLSLLICNLCLDEQVWEQMAQHLAPTMTISDVVVSAKTLLINLRTLEMAQLEGEVSMLGDNSAMDGFTSRFEQIISAVRHS